MCNNDGKHTNEYTHEFMSICHRMKKLFAAKTGKNGLYQGEFITLAVIDHISEINKAKGILVGAKVGEIGKGMRATKSATSKMLRSLEEKGYIMRASVPKDRRTVYVQLTEEGNVLISEAKMRMHLFSEEVLKEFGDKEMETLIQGMSRLCDIMEAKADSFFDSDSNVNNEEGDNIC